MKLPRPITMPTPKPRLVYVDGRHRNAHEHAFQKKAAAKGYFVTKRGWPDFFCLDLQGRPFVVEVKPRRKDGRTHRLRKSQSLVLQHFRKLGVRCYVSDGATLEPYDPAKHDRP